MLTKSIRDRFLVDELQLGQQLNEALHQENRSEFSLLLSMLSDDLLDHPNYADAQVHPPDAINWRARMELPPPVRLDATNLEPEETEFRSLLLQEGGIHAVQLFNAIAPEALTWRQFMIPADVWDELTPLQQQKYKAENTIEHQQYPETPDDMMAVLEGFDYTQDFVVNYYYR